MRLLVLSFLVFFSAFSQARVFSFKDRRVAPFFRGSIAYSHLGEDAFSNSSYSGATRPALEGEIPWNYGAELGLSLGLTDTFFVRLGAEAVRASNGAVKGSDPGGTLWFDLDTSVFAFNPSVTFEYDYYQVGNSRFYFLLGGGSANVTLVNRYTMTAAGQTALGVASFNEKAEARVYSGHTALGMETLFADNVTFMIDLGYRYMPIPELKLKADVASIAQPTGLKGGVLKNSDGTTRDLTLSGFYTSIGFKFYLSFL